jgi:hypothetical protein
MNEITTTNGNGALMSFIERAAKDETFDVQKFEVLLRLQMEVSDKQARRAFNAAMAVAQSEMMPVIRTAQNKHLGNKYAKLEDIDREMRPIYTRHGFSVRFGSAPSPREDDMRITCTVAHADGYSEENHLDAPSSVLGSQGGRMAVTPVQAVGSTITYLRRYLLTMVFNLVLEDDDDDGEATRRAAAGSTPRRTIGQLLEAVEFALKRASSRAEVDRILDAEDVLKLRANVAADSPAILRLDAMRDEALELYPPMSDEDDDLPEVEIEGQDKVMAGDD